MRKTKLWRALIAIVILALTCVWYRVHHNEQQAISEGHIDLTIKSETPGEFASVQLRVRARLSQGRLQQELRHRHASLQRIFNNTTNVPFGAPETTRAIRQELLVELRPVPVIKLTWEVKALSGRHPNPEILELLKKSPGTLGYVDPEAEH